MLPAQLRSFFYSRWESFRVLLRDFNLNTFPSILFSKWCAFCRSCCPQRLWFIQLFTSFNSLKHWNYVLFLFKIQQSFFVTRHENSSFLKKAEQNVFFNPPSLMYLHVIYKFPTNFIDFLRKKNFNFQIQLNMWISDQPGAYVTLMNRIFITCLTC